MILEEKFEVNKAFQEGKTIIQVSNDRAGIVKYINKKENPDFEFDYYNNTYLVYVPSSSTDDLDLECQLEILQAYKDGKTIEFYDNGWWTISKKHYIFDFKHNQYRIKPESKTRRMTNRELAKWLAEGKGQYITVGYPTYAYTHFDYRIDEDDFDEGEVDDAILIRSWNETEWHEPLITEKE